MVQLLTLSAIITTVEMVVLVVVRVRTIPLQQVTVAQMALTVEPLYMGREQDKGLPLGILVT